MFANTTSEKKQLKIDSLKQELKKDLNTKTRVKTLRKLDNLIYLNDSDLDLKLLTEIVQICELQLTKQLNEKDLAFYQKKYGNALNDIGLVYQDKLNYKLALTTSFKTLKFLEEYGKTDQIHRAHNNIGIIYSKMDNDDIAIKYYNKVIEDTDTSIDKITLADALNNKAISLKNIKKESQAIVNFHRSIIIYKKYNKVHRDLLAKTYNSIGDLFYSMNNLDSSETYYNNSLLIAQEINYSVAISRSYLGLSQIALKKKNYNTAIKFANKTLTFKGEQYLSKSKDANKFLYLSYNALGQTKKALTHYETYILLKDSLEAKKEKELAYKINLNYEYEKKHLTDSLTAVKEKELLNQQHQQLIKNEESKTYLASLFFGIALLIVLLLWFAYKQKKSSNLLLIDKNKLTEQALKDKELFMKEIHHRVKNNMQMVSSILQLKSTETDNQEIKKELLDSQSRIHSMSLAHKKMYEDNNFEQINLSTYVEEIIATVFNTHKNKGLDSFIFNGDNILINVEQGQAVGFIMHEIALNSIKYAWDENDIKKLTVSVLQNNNTINISYKDNGKGLPSDFNIETVTSMGLKLVRSFTKRQLKGDIKFLSDNGTSVSLSFTPRA